MCNDSCPMIPIPITPGTELDIRAIRPEPSKEYEDGSYEVMVDPVSLSYMMSSVGIICPVALAIEDINKYRRRFEGLTKEHDHE